MQWILQSSEEKVILLATVHTCSLLDSNRSQSQPVRLRVQRISRCMNCYRCPDVVYGGQNGIQDRIGEVLDGVHYTEGQITTPRKTTAHGQSEAQHRHSLGH